jgi:undecaprenyl diphosphate synthase
MTPETNRNQFQRIPRHVAIIMDGNGRWAEARGYPRAFGHIRGASRIKPLVLEADRLGVKAFTLYAFSTENWKRPEAELKVLWKLLVKFLKREEAELHRNGVRLCVVGEKHRLPQQVLEVLDPVLDRLKNNKGITLNFAVSYGSRQEIVSAIQGIAEKVANGLLKPESITEQTVDTHLWTSHLGEISDVDLLIRTSGEYRISNYLLWQSAYAEFVFLEKNWPDFETKDLHDAFTEFGKRDRRFGGLNVANEHARGKEKNGI